MADKLREKKGNTEDEMLALAEFKGVDVSEIEEGYSDHVYEVDGEEYWVSDYDTAYDEAVSESESLFDELGLEAVSEATQEYFLENEEYCNFPWEDDMHESHLIYARDIHYESDAEYGTRLVQECDDEVSLDDEDGGYVITFEDGNGDIQYVYDKKSYGDDIDKAERFLTESNAMDFDTDKIEDDLTEQFGEDFEFSPSVAFEKGLIDEDDLAERLADALDKDFNSMSEYYDNVFGRHWAREMKETLENYLDYHAMAKYVVDEDGIANTLARYDGYENSEENEQGDFFIYRTN